MQDMPVWEYRYDDLDPQRPAWRPHPYMRKLYSFERYPVNNPNAVIECCKHLQQVSREAYRCPMNHGWKMTKRGFMGLGHAIYPEDLMYAYNPQSDSLDCPFCDVKGENRANGSIWCPSCGAMLRPELPERGSSAPAK